jgi:heme-degrading monooxygenase HmoA
VFAGLTTTVLGADQPDATEEIMKSLLPTLRGLPGFKGVLVMANPKTHIVHGITLWESAEALKRSESVMDGIRDAETTNREVVAQETGEFEVTAIHLARS